LRIVIIAEPGALSAFAGARVTANTIREELSEGFQTAESLLEHGFIDRIASRKELRGELARLIDCCERRQRQGLAAGDHLPAPASPTSSLARVG